MTQAELKNRIVEKSIPHFMVWESRSKYFNDLYINKIKEVYNLEVVFLYEFEEIVQIHKATFDGKLFVMFNNSLGPIKNAPELAPRNFFIVIVENIGQGLKNSFGDKLVSFYDFDKTNVGSLLKDMYPLNSRQAEKISELCNNDIYKSILELDKVSMLKGNFVDNLNMLTGEDIMDFSIKFDVFGLVNMVVNKSSNAIDEMQEFLSADQNIIGFITLLYHTYKNILQIKEQPYYDVADIEKCTGIKSGMIYAIKKNYNINNFSVDYLENKMFFCSSLIKGIKDGIYTEEEAFYYSCFI